MSMITELGHSAFESTLGKVRQMIALETKKFRTNSTRMRIYRQTLDELSGLNARDLADLGIARCNIRYLARKAAQTADVE